MGAPTKLADFFNILLVAFSFGMNKEGLRLMSCCFTRNEVCTSSLDAAALVEGRSSARRVGRVRKQIFLTILWGVAVETEEGRDPCRSWTSVTY
jgi:hypothetical protein